MKRSKMIVPCLVTVLAAFAANASVAAAALPEFSSNTTYTASTGAATLETVSGATVSCASGSESGSITGPKTATASDKFTGCTALILGKAQKCGTPASGGEIVTKPLSATLGYINKGTKEVGLSFKPTSGTVVAEFECETTAGAKTKITVSGGVIGPLTPINTLTETLSNIFTQSKGVQAVTKLEGETENVLSTVIGAAAGSKSGLAKNWKWKFKIEFEVSS